MTSTTSRVAFNNLQTAHAEQLDEINGAFQAVLTSSGFIGGRAVAEFEERWATYCGTKHCVSVGNGTDALEISLQALGIGPGDEVIVPANTFVATPLAIANVGATPVFIDVEASTLLVNAELISAAITPKTAAVMVVHLYGQMPDMDAIAALCERAGVVLIEDAAQAHGAEWKGRRAGSFGRAAAFSFYPGKNLGALGDGGALVTADVAVADRARLIARHGRTDDDRFRHRVQSRNSRLDSLQAAILGIKLAKLDEWNERRRRIHDFYVELLSETGVTLVATTPGAIPVFHVEAALVPERDRLAKALSAEGIETNMHYPIPCHKQPAFDHLPPVSLPVVERAAASELSLPMHPFLTRDDVESVARAVKTSLEMICG